MIPQGELRVEAHMTNPPTPIGFHVVVQHGINMFTTVAVLSIAEVERVYKQYVAMQEVSKR